jgi:peptide/nickel transport system permease protein
MLTLYVDRFKRNGLALAGIGVLFLLVLLALVGPAVIHLPPTAQNLLERLEPPSSVHWMGTDDLGRDVFARMIAGARVSLAIGFISVAVAVSIGTCLGLVAGFFGGWWDALIMRTVDVMLSIPTIFLLLTVLAFLNPSIYNVMAVIGLTAWPGLARLVRGECLSVRERDYILAARIAGIPTSRILFIHVLPNVIAPILVSATLGVGGAVLTESALSFLGLGVQPPMASWGNILALGRDYLHLAWWLCLFPSIAILVTVMAFNFLGEGLRDVLDPRV